MINLQNKRISERLIVRMVCFLLWQLGWVNWCCECGWGQKTPLRRSPPAELRLAQKHQTRQVRPQDPGRLELHQHLTHSFIHSFYTTEIASTFTHILYLIRLTLFYLLRQYAQVTLGCALSNPVPKNHPPVSTTTATCR